MDLAPSSPNTQASSLTVLGLESSCDETAAAILRRHVTGEFEILADLVLGQTEAHAPFGGVVPEIAARAHAEAIDGLAAAALHEAGLSLDQIDGIAATSGPGLIGGVMAALMTAKGLALGAGKPLIAVNHLEGHALSPRLSQSAEFPYLLLLVSGGHTQLLIAEDVGVYHRLGSTIDDAAGEAFDKTAKVMGLGFPGGPALERCAHSGDANRFALPVPMKSKPGCDFSFAGLKTAARQIWDGLEQPSEQDKADLAASVQHAIARALAARSKRAMAMFKERFGHAVEPSPFIVAGGVAANGTVRTMLADMAETEGFELVAPPMKWYKMKILLSNDDGVHAQGVHELADELRDLAEVIIVAPDRNRSGASNSLTLEQPLRVQEIAENTYSVQGTPTDCVHFALNELLKDDMPDLVLTGINHGANLGDDVLYSGTVAAAMEGHFLGVQSVAFSLVGKKHFKTAAAIARRIVEQHLAKPIPTNRLLNVNVPDLSLEELSGTQVTRLGARHHAEDMIKQKDPRGHDIYWLGPPGKEQDAGEGTDFYAIEHGFVSVTPLQVDLTAHESLGAMTTWLGDK